MKYFSTMSKSTKKQDEGQFGLFQLSEIPDPFKKAVEIVHSQPKAPMSLVQRKLSNAWLKNAAMNPPDAEGWWSISSKAMVEDIGFDSKNFKHLTDAAREMMAIVFEWDVYGKERKFKASVLFPEIEITAFTTRYQISGQLRKHVLNPDVYAIIDMTEIKKLRRGASVAIYENCIRFLNVGWTPAMPWQQLRDMVLGGSSSYEEYKHFKAKVLKPSLAEINSLTGIHLTLVDKPSGGKRVTDVKFKVERTEVETDQPDTEEQMQVIGEMIALGMAQSDAKKLCKAHSVGKAEAAVAYTKKMIVQGAKKGEPIENTAGYLKRSLEKGWGVVDAGDNTPSPTPVVPRANKNKLEEAFKAQRRGEAQVWFKEVPLTTQEATIGRYNEYQQTTALKIKAKGKSSKAVESAFSNWLANDLWGVPTDEEMLEFAKNNFAGK